MDKTKLNLLLQFLLVANKHLNTFSEASYFRSSHVKRGEVRNFFNYMSCPVDVFFRHAERFELAEIQHALECIETGDWDQSEFIMSCECLK